MTPTLRHHLAIAGSVALFHVAALWALQTGLIQRVVAAVLPVVVFSEFIEPPQPKVTPPPLRPRPVVPTLIKRTASLPPPPMPLAVADAAPAPNAPTGMVHAPLALPPMTAPVAATPTLVASPPKVELPSSDADYLQNPRPAYPAMSKRLGEQGRVIVRVLIGVDGSAQKVEIRQSSGFERLDQAALATTQRWRYVPGKRGGVAEAMWFNVPINFVLE